MSLSDENLQLIGELTLQAGSIVHELSRHVAGEANIGSAARVSEIRSQLDIMIGQLDAMADVIMLEQLRQVRSQVEAKGPNAGQAVNRPK